MSLIKKHFIKVAEILNRSFKNAENQELAILYDIQDEFIEWFKSENPDFNEERFKQAVLN